VSKVYAWNLDMKKILKDVSEDHDGMVARFNYDWKEAEAWKTVGNKEFQNFMKQNIGFTSRYQSTLELTVGHRAELLKPTFKRRFYDYARVIDKATTRV